MTDLTPLSIGSLRPSDFPELGLTSRQLHVWTDLTGFQPAERDDGKWRYFSPADVFRLFVMRDLKKATGLAISDHPHLVASIRADDFFAQAVALWTKDALPCLVTDFDRRHDLMAAGEVNAADLMQLGRPHCLLPLPPALEHMAAAIARSGTQEQRLLIHALVVARPRQTEAIPDRQGDAPVLRRAAVRGDRAIDLDEAEPTLSPRRSPRTP